MGCSQSRSISSHDEIREIEKYIESISNPKPIHKPNNKPNPKPIPKPKLPN